MAQVQIIQPYQPQSDALEKVAAYCRVSTDSSDQLNSYHTQIGYYTNFIAQHPGWELVDIYADEGITGTSLEKRDEFKRMLADCRAGKISRILVKSVSRFARNTLELIETTRELKNLGVVVVLRSRASTPPKCWARCSSPCWPWPLRRKAPPFPRICGGAIRSGWKRGAMSQPKLPMGMLIWTGDSCLFPKKQR